jgi:hypothetical protein
MYMRIHTSYLTTPHQLNLPIDMIYVYLTAIGSTPSGNSTAHIYTQTVHRIQRTEHT